MRVVIMGVSGAGKTVVGRALADRLDLPFLDADDYHPRVNKTRMAGGKPLTDAHRWPWLDRLGAELERRSDGCVLACSALKRSYRDRLRAACPDLRIVHLDAPFDLVRERLDGREGHFMPRDLLQSQFDTLEDPTGEEGVVAVGVDRKVEAVAAAAAEALA